jgi:tRNA (guanine37-N1)-methyltransferase
LSSKRKPLQFHILTLFPEVFPAVLGSSLLGKARKKGLVSFDLVQIRDFATDKHRTVDDTPYGGGEGMVMRADVVYEAWKSVAPRKAAAGAKKRATVFLSPQGRMLTQSVARELADYEKIILVCGHYEGVDERFIEECVDFELSIGDYVLTGGELPALVVMDAVTRLLPDVVGNPRSITEDSLEGGLLKYPQYTRPREWRGREVPAVLLEGDHGKIRAWRDEKRLERTARKRPDLSRQKP